MRIRAVHGDSFNVGREEGKGIRAAHGGNYLLNLRGISAPSNVCELTMLTELTKLTEFNAH